MKTWEMIKYIEENPKASFIPKQEKHNKILMINGVLSWKNGNPFVMNMRTDSETGRSIPSGTLEKYEWEAERVPVDFMTAVNSGKLIMPIRLDANKWGFRNLDYWCVNRDSINGQWLIK